MKFRTRKKVSACLLGNARLDPLKIDPSRTVALRRGFGVVVSRAFARLKGAVVRLVDVDDAFGLKPRNHLIVGNTAWQFTTDPEKVKAFAAWLRTQFDAYLTGKTDEELWRLYTIAGFKKGQQRSFDDWLKGHPEALAEQDDAYAGGAREQFLRESFNAPVSVDKVKLLAGRSFDDLKNVTHDMSTRMTRALADGLVQGKSPREIARDLNKQVDIGRDRALVVARSELIRAHAEGQLTALKNLGVEELGVMVEWSTTGDKRVCPRCRNLQGIVLKIDEATGLIPAHPLCRCAFIPANVGESSKGQVRGAAAIREALKRSKRKSGNSAWGRGKRISTARPVSILDK